MGCHRLERVGRAWAAGDLAPREAEELRLHLVSCPTCRALAAALTAASQQARSALAEPGELDDADWARILAGLPEPGPRPVLRREWLWALLATSAVAALLALVLLLPGRGRIAPGAHADAGLDAALSAPSASEPQVAVAVFPTQASERFELRLATADPKIKVVWVFDKDFEL